MRKYMPCITWSVSNIWHAWSCNTAETPAKQVQIHRFSAEMDWILSVGQIWSCCAEKWGRGSSHFQGGQNIKGCTSRKCTRAPSVHLVTTPLGDTCRQHDEDFQLYADDTQLYALFNTSSEESRHSCMTKINSCVADISTWMSTNLLKVN